MSKLISIGKILNFHGIKGEVKMGYSSGKEDLVSSLRKVYIYINNQKISYDVSSVRFHKNFAIVKFKQINSINEVMDIKGLLVHTTEENLKKQLQKDEYLISDLIGMDVFDFDNNKLGVIESLGDNKASDLIKVVKNNGLSFVVPFVKELVKKVDIENNKVIINLIEGLDTTIVKGEQ